VRLTTTPSSESAVSLSSFSPMMWETLAELAMKLVIGEMSYEAAADSL
jgi:hypothetical protein